jgi:hypothetical protein
VCGLWRMMAVLELCYAHVSFDLLLLVFCWVKWGGHQMPPSQQQYPTPGLCMYYVGLYTKKAFCSFASLTRQTMPGRCGISCSCGVLNPWQPRWGFAAHDCSCERALM